jgi:hypothetical protein
MALQRIPLSAFSKIAQGIVRPEGVLGLRDGRVVAHDPAGELARSPTNIAWGGPDLTNLYIGDLHTGYVLTAKSPVPGMPLRHQIDR